MKNKNYLSFQIAIIVVLTLLLSNIFILQVINSKELKDVTEEILTETISVVTKRGSITDADGEILASDIKVSYLFIPETIEIEEVDLNLIIESKVLKDFNSESLSKKREYKIGGDISKILGIIEKYDLQIIERFEREYAYSNLYGSIIGNVGSIDPETLENDSFYEITDSVGRSHIEKYFENELRGTKGFSYTNGSQELYQNGEEGSDITLTIDTAWQESLQNILLEYKDRHGAVAATGIIMNSETGAIRAMADVPTISLDSIYNLSTTEYEAIINDPGRPLINKNIGFSAEPGSIFKVVTAFDLFENQGVINDDYIFSNRCIQLGIAFDFCEFNQNFYGNVNLNKALVYSSNIYFCELLSESTDLSTFEETQRLLGIDNKSDLPIDSSVAGIISGPSFSDEWFRGDTCNASIGQGGIKVTPYNALLFTNAVLNNGVTKNPYIVDVIRDSYGEKKFESKSENVLDVDSDSDAFNSIREGMKSAISDPSGALYWNFVGLEENNIHGKTGTAESGIVLNGEYRETIHGWFIGEFTYESTPYTFVFHINHGGGGYETSFILKDFLGCLNSDFTDSICK